MKKIAGRGDAPFKIRKITAKAERMPSAGVAGCSPETDDGTDKPPC